MLKALDIWLPAYLRQLRWHPSGQGATDILFCVCDHFEPLHGADKAEALARIATWRRQWPTLIGPFKDADGCRPKHTFFYPVEQYDRDILDAITEVCQLSGGEVEVHLHHDRDTAEGLREKLERGKEDLGRHGLLGRDQTGRVRYGFIHGNWALDNSHPQGRHCGVRNELSVLAETGCYADFTMPSAPDPTQTRTINRIYYAWGTSKPKSHDVGIRATVKVKADGKKDFIHNVAFTFPVDEKGSVDDTSHELLLVQGPLGLNWECRKFGVLPRIENGEISGVNPPRPERMRVWLRLGIHVQAQPNWLFIKLHTHGGIPRNMRTLLEDPMRQFYDYLLGEYNDGKEYRTHFVTAREMVNIVHAAEDGHVGNAGAFRDHRFNPPRILKGLAAQPS